MRLRPLRMLVVAGVVLAPAAGCSSSAKPESAPATSSTTTTGATAPSSTIPDREPFDVGELVALSNGWSAQVEQVRRPFTPADLPAVPVGQEYVSVDVLLQNDGPGTAKVTAAKLYEIIDDQGRRYSPSSSNGINGQYPPGTTRQGTLVFAVPVQSPLLLAVDGVIIGTQRSVFRIDPPTDPAGD